MKVKIHIPISPQASSAVESRATRKAFLAAFKAAILAEDARYYAHQRYHGGHGAAGLYEKGDVIGWETSAGNLLLAEDGGCNERGEGLITLTVDGRRHGIPWRFYVIACHLLQENPLELLEAAEVEMIESQSSCAPWRTGDGKLAPDLYRALREYGQLPAAAPAE